MLDRLIRLGLTSVVLCFLIAGCGAGSRETDVHSDNSTPTSSPGASDPLTFEMSPVPRAVETLTSVSCSGPRCAAAGFTRSHTGAIVASDDEGRTWFSSTVPTGLFSIDDVFCADAFCIAVAGITGGGGVTLRTDSRM